MLIPDYERIIHVSDNGTFDRYVPSPSLISSKSDAWTSVLKLATQWQFDDVRKRAVEALEDQEKDTVQKITLGRQYSISGWLVAAYVELASRHDSNPLTAEEEKALGDGTVVKLLKMEVERQKAKKEGTSYHLTEKVKEVFRDELMADEEYRRTSTTVTTASHDDAAPA